MKVEVTQEHIDKGIMSDEESCPMALAIIDKTDNAVSVGLENIELSDDGLWLLTKKYAHTQVSYQFIRNFDDGNEVKPHTFIFKELI